jgi:hypothetical protein
MERGKLVSKYNESMRSTYLAEMPCLLEALRRTDVLRPLLGEGVVRYQPQREITSWTYRCLISVSKGDRIDAIDVIDCSGISRIVWIGVNS